jgi:D-3-phosphoglycerate dehydrogenase
MSPAAGICVDALFYIAISDLGFLIKELNVEPSKRVLLPQPIEAEAVKALEKAGVGMVLAEYPSPETVRPLLDGVQGLILRTGIKITQDLMDLADDLQVISRTGGGLDNVDVDAATDRNIIVTSNLGVNTSSVVEHALALMLALIKQLPVMDQAIRNGEFKIRYKGLPRDLRGKTLGLLGFGRIGSELGRCCRELFDMRVVSHDPYVSETVRAGYEGQVGFVELEELFHRSDVLSIHVPLTEKTHHAVGEEALALMKPSAIIINTARGPIIDQSALFRALQDKKIAGAGLDVFEKEPVSEDNPLLGLDNIIMTPHSAALTQECVIRMAVEAVNCTLAVFYGRVPPNVANPQVLATDRWKHLKPAVDEQ